MKARRNSKRRSSGRSGGSPDRAVARSDVGARFGAFGPESIETDPITGSPAQVRRIQPYAAQKTYVCPGCNQEILPGVGHLVVVPLAEPSERRHWHSGCWQHRHRRPTGR